MLLPRLLQCRKSIVRYIKEEEILQDPCSTVDSGYLASIHDSIAIKSPVEHWRVYTNSRVITSSPGKYKISNGNIVCMLDSHDYR